MLRIRNFRTSDPTTADITTATASSTTASPITPSILSPSPKPPLKTASEKISECLYAGETVDLEKLKKLSWTGIPEEFRAICWKILMVRE